MAQVIVTIPDDFAPRVMAAFSKNYGYQAFIGVDDQGNPVPNPQSLFDFVVQQRIKFLKDNVKAAEVPDLAKADRQAQVDGIDAVIITIVPVPPQQPAKPQG
jgi:hypothetical protein